MNTVLFIRSQSSHLPSYQERLVGVLHYARTRNWNVQTIDKPTLPQVRKLLAFWNPVGCIVESGSGRNSYPERVFARVPVVYLDREPQTLAGKAFCIASDSVAIAELAAKELLSLGFPHYGFAGNFEKLYWSEKRCEVFCNAVELSGKSCQTFIPLNMRGESVEFRKKLRAWIREIPKPCGIFAANDPVGAAVLSACMEEKIAVPEEVAVIGVDNLEILCENTHPTLSSIRQDYEKAGWLSAELLDRRIRNPSLKPQSLIFGSIGVIRRLSTRKIRHHNAWVMEVVERIRREACSGLKARDVVAGMKCSRRLAEIRFREVLGHSILDEIREVRFMRACVLLQNPDLTVSAVVERCGYRSEAHLRNMFRERTGQSMRTWRKRHGFGDFAKQS